MFVITQDRSCSVNIDRVTFIKRNSKVVSAQVGYILDASNVSRPITIFLGEYETEEDAQIALDKIIAGIQCSANAKIVTLLP